MWLWWIISLIVLITCFIFAYRMIMSSNDYLPSDKKKFFPIKKIPISQKTAAPENDFANIKNKLQSVEDNSSFYEVQFSKLQHRLTALEELYGNQRQQSSANFQKEPEEDWKELYYQENEKKEKLENELDEACQQLEEYKNELVINEEKNQKWIELQSNYDSRQNEVQSLQNTIELMQRKLEGAANREKELEQILLAEIELKKKYSRLESDFARLRSEAEDLRRQVTQMAQKEKEHEEKVVRLNSLESKVKLYEEEKAKMISRLELMVSQNKIFS